MYAIDCNSFQVTRRTNRGNEFYPSGVATEAYAAPEVQPTDWSTSPRTIFSDSFGLAVACWLVLFNGSHPFAVASPPNVDVPPLGERIERRLFPFAPTSSLPPGWKPPPLDPPLAILPADVREMFFRTFSTADPRSRPSAEDWCRAFRSWERSLWPSIPLPKMSPWCAQHRNRLSTAIGTVKFWSGRGFVLLAIVLLALFLPRDEAPTSIDSKPVTDRPVPTPKQPTPEVPRTKRPLRRSVDPDLFPESFWDSSTPKKE